MTVIELPTQLIDFSPLMKPTIVFAPGAWHQPSCFDRIRQSLHGRGYSTDAVSYPSVGFQPNSTLSDDATALRGVLEKVVSTGKEVVLVLHSYGGMVGSNAVDGLGVHERAQQRKKGGVIMVVFMAAFAVPKGKSVRDVPTGASWIKFEVNSLDMSREAGVTSNRPGHATLSLPKRCSTMTCRWTSSERRSRN